MQPKKGGKKAVAAKRHRKPVRSFARYIYAVLKSVHPVDQGISKKAMAIVNSFVGDMFDKIAAEAGRLARYNKRQTLTSREMQAAVRLLMPGELARHATSEGMKAVTKYNARQAGLLTPKQRANAEAANL